MYGIETAYCNAMISALLNANSALMTTTVQEAIDASYVVHKGDTLGIDQVPENTIASGLTAFDQYAVLITEERGEDANPLARQSALSVRGPRTFFVCDPCDRSDQFRTFLEEHRNSAKRVGDVLAQKKSAQVWEQKYNGPAAITGANAAITCVRRGLPIGAVLLNYITQTVTVACSAGIYQAEIPKDNADQLNLDKIKFGSRVIFPNTKQSNVRMYTTFMGKPERGYPQNFAMTKLADEDNAEANLHYGKPGGPTRILYLSDQQPENNAIGFIVANGEKIGEWVHWLPFIRYASREDDCGAKALRIFEITQEESTLRDGYLMTPTEPYSIFKEVTNGSMVINVDRLGDFNNPSKYRATLLITSSTNDWAIGRAHQYGYRELAFYGD